MTFLGEIPIDPRVTVQGDAGEPIAYSHPDAPVSQAYFALADAVKGQLDKAAKEQAELPSLEL
jgi:ATP-binding protein involved in chromosome partitioning